MYFQLSQLRCGSNKAQICKASSFWPDCCFSNKEKNGGAHALGAQPMYACAKDQGFSLAVEKLTQDQLFSLAVVGTTVNLI